MDRIDIHVEVPAISYKKLTSETPQEKSAQIRKRIYEARNLQLNRLSLTNIFCNAQMSNRHIKKYCRINTESSKLLENAIEKLGLSARAYNRILKIARTIADLSSESNIAPDHIYEAIQYRNLDRSKSSR